MATNANTSRANQDLRQRAEALINQSSHRIHDIPAEDIKRLIEELSIHQVELEIQNEELRRAQLEIETQRDKYTHLFDFSPVGYVTLNSKGIVLEANLTMVDMLGHERAALVKHPFSEFIVSEDEDCYYRCMSKLKKSRGRQTCELRLLQENGPSLAVCLECIPILDADENVDQIRTAVTDITQRKLAEAKIQEYQGQLKCLASELTLTEERLKGNLATHLHDRISQLLAITKMKLDQIREAMDDSAGRKAVTDVMAMVSDALNESQSLTLQLSYPTLAVLGLSKAVEQWLRQEIAEKHGLHVRFSDDGLDKPLAEDVKAVVFRSVREILNNVVKHAQAHNVTVRIRQEERDMVVSVADDGIGFDPQAFKAKGGGFGLLSIQTSLERLGGRLDIESREGPGSLLFLRVPLTLGERQRHKEGDWDP